MKGSRNVFWWVTAFSIAMGFLETAVVIYLRKIYYPHGFSFPLQPVSHDVAVVELWREAATLIMLAATGILAGRNRAEKFAYYLYAFAVWDIAYYVFLKVFLGWPQSIYTWDILFLIPVPWVGPVIAPVIIAATMILFAVTVIRFTDRQVPVSMNSIERWALWSGAVTVIISFILDYVSLKGTALWDNLKGNHTMFANLADYVPQQFNWLLFFAGEVVILLAYFLYLERLRRRGRLPVGGRARA